MSSDLGNTGRTKPVSLWHLSDFGPQAVHVTAPITAVTQQQAVIIVSFPANLASLDREQTRQNCYCYDDNELDSGVCRVLPENIK